LKKLNWLPTRVKGKFRHREKPKGHFRQQEKPQGGLPFTIDSKVRENEKDHGNREKEHMHR
jgi:hypothetical protein